MNFISGTYFKHKCRYVIGDYVSERKSLPTFRFNEEVNNNLVFIKAEYIPFFFYGLKYGMFIIEEPQFSIVTHNSDLNIDALSSVNALLEVNDRLDTWYAQNLCVFHPKLRAIPIGIANPKWSHGQTWRFNKIIEEGNEKAYPFFADFNVKTNPGKRRKCIEGLGLDKFDGGKYPNWIDIADHNRFVEDTQEAYLRRMSQSYFTISPPGNGTDAHRTWEALYMGSIPVVENSFMSRQFVKLGIPMVLVDDWSEFDLSKCNEELYKQVWGDFNPESLEGMFI